MDTILTGVRLRAPDHSAYFAALIKRIKTALAERRVHRDYLETAFRMSGNRLESTPRIPFPSQTL